MTFKYVTQHLDREAAVSVFRLTHNVFVQRAFTEHRLCTQHGLGTAGDGEAAAPSNHSDAELQVLDWKQRQGRDPHPGCSQGRLPERGGSCVGLKPGPSQIPGALGHAGSREHLQSGASTGGVKLQPSFSGGTPPGAKRWLPNS